MLEERIEERKGGREVVVVACAFRIGAGHDGVQPGGNVLGRLCGQEAGELP